MSGYVPMSTIEAKESGAGYGILPAGAYVCYVVDAYIECSKSGKANLNIVWDVAEGEHKGWFASAIYGHTEYLGIEGNAAAYTKHKLNKISESNSQQPVSFDAVALVDGAAAQFFNSGKTGKINITQMQGKYIGLTVGTSDELYNGNVQHWNYVDMWLTPSEIKAMKYTTSDGKTHDVRIPPHKDKTQGSGSQAPIAQSEQGATYDVEIPF